MLWLWKPGRTYMRASVMLGINEPLEIRELTLDNPHPREVLVRIAATGICHSDRHAYSGGVPGTALPCVLGHESAGIVELVGSEVKNFRPGDYVVISPAGSCGLCYWCGKGFPQHCSDLARSRAKGEEARITLDGEVVSQFVGIGGLAEKALVQESSLAPVPKNMPLDRAALLGCAVTTGLGSIIHSANVQVGQTVAIIGCGGVGLSAIQGARLVGADRIIAVDRVASKLALAQGLGATDVVDATDEDPVAAVLELTGGVDHALEFVGLPGTIQQAFNMLTTRGTATIVGLVNPGATVNLPAPDFLKEKVIQGSRLGGTQLRTDIPLYARW